MSSQMTQLVMAQRGFQAAVQITKDAQDSYRRPRDRKGLMSIARHRDHRLHAVRAPHQ